MAARITLTRPPKGKLDRGGQAGPGRGKGTPNKTTRLLREAIILAAEAVGDEKGKGELVGYLQWIAKKYPDLFCTLLGRVLPMQLIGPSDGPVRVEVELTLTQMQKRLEERGIPAFYDEPLTIEHQPAKPNGHSTNGHAN